LEPPDIRKGEGETDSTATHRGQRPVGKKEFYIDDHFREKEEESSRSTVEIGSSEKEGRKTRGEI